MRTVVVADRKLSRRIVDRSHMMPRAYARPEVRRLNQCAVAANRKYRNAAAAIVGGKYEFPGWMHADVGRRRPAGTERAQAPDLQTVLVDSIGDDGTAYRRVWSVLTVSQVGLRMSSTTCICVIAAVA